jgi:hypothetical protein
VKVELLYFDDCPNHEAVFRSLRRALDRAGVSVDIECRRVISVEDAQRWRFLGSPTVRIDGEDVDPSAAGRSDYGLSCRVYRSAEQTFGTLPEGWIAAAIQHARSTVPVLSKEKQ